MKPLFLALRLALTFAVLALAGCANHIEQNTDDHGRVGNAYYSLVGFRR